jgi:hypothetical protein
MIEVVCSDYRQLCLHSISAWSRSASSAGNPVRSSRLIGGRWFLSRFLKKPYDRCAESELNQFSGQTKFKWHFADEVTGFVETFGWEGGE